MTLLVLLIALLMLVFALENQQSVSLLFLGWAGPQLPVSLLIIIALLIGMLIGPALAWILASTSRASRKRSA